SPISHRRVEPRCHPWSDQSSADSVCTSGRIPHGCAQTVLRRTREAFVHPLHRKTHKGFGGIPTPANKMRTAGTAYRRHLPGVTQKVMAGNYNAGSGTWSSPD